MFLKNTWYAAIWNDELKAGEIVRRRFLDVPIVLFRNNHGLPQALMDVCPHRGAPLSLGKMVNGQLRCGYHGLEFDGSGACVHNPHAGGAIPAAMKVRSYPTVEKHTMVWIWMGDEQADPEQIPDFGLMDPRPDGLARARNYLHVAANYLLIVDNLLDLSHANYLHEGILGLPEHSQARVEVRQEGTTIRCHRKMSDVPIAKLHDLLFRRDGQSIDMWNDIIWDVPGCMKLVHGFSQPGASTEEKFEFTAVHLLTPETDVSSHYSYGIVRPPATDDETEVNETVAETRKFVFESQDRRMLDAQQRNLSEMPDQQQVLLSIDGASVRMRRTMSKLIAAEADRSARPSAPNVQSVS